jgi:hypothetical protein
MSSRSPRALILSLGLSVPILVAAGQAIVGCVFNSASDCELTRGFGCGGAPTTSTNPGGRGGDGTGGTGGSSSSSSSSSGTGGTGTTTTLECSDASMCTALSVPPGPCASLGKVACTQGKCVLEYTAGDAPSQKYGDCKKTVCDASGVATTEPDDTDVYDDGNPCTEEKCTSGAPTRMDLPGGSPCMIGGSSGFCTQSPDPYNSALVVCSECDPNGFNTCVGSATCVKGKCVPLHCTNTTKDSGESDIDCGGSASGCLKCPANKGCTNGMADCWSGLCLGNKCQPSQCADGVKNADETDADCGGLLCGNLCDDGLACIIASDCKSKVCMGNVCQAPTCTDGEQNGDEEGVDCGGAVSACPACG